MSVSVKVNGTTYSGVNKVQLEDATTSGTFIDFSNGGGGIEGGYNIIFKVDGTDAFFASVAQGESITSNPYTPQKNNYRFLGWATTSGGTPIVFPYTPSADGTLYAVWEEGVRCTVSNLGASSPSAVSFSKDANFTKAGLGIEEVTVGSDVFVKIPTMYRKVNTVVDNQITSFTIANAKIDNDYEPYSCFVAEDGSLLPYILIGKYWNTSANSCVSTTAASATSVTTAVGRANAKAKGTGYQLFDWQMQKLWQDLIICFKETVNTNTGTAWTYDELGIYWTTSGGWIDGVMGSSGTWKLCTKPSKYASLGSESDPVPSDYVSAGYAQPTTSDREIQKLGYDSNNPFFNFPSAVTSNSSYNTYYCDGYWYNSGNRPVGSDVGAAYANRGAFFCSANYGWSLTSGVRLCYRPLSA